MKRRKFISLLGSAAAWPLAARAQAPAHVYRLGVMVGQARDSAMVAAFFDELRVLGFIEGQNLAIVAGGFGLRDEQRPALAAEVVKSAPDVIWNIGSTIRTHTLRELTQTIPIVTLGDDMLGEGVVQSLARPGGNTTGISILSPELDSKRQDILIDAVPGVRRLAALADSKVTTSQQLHVLQEAVRGRGIERRLFGSDARGHHTRDGPGEDCGRCSAQRAGDATICDQQPGPRHGPRDGAAIACHLSMA